MMLSSFLSSWLLWVASFIYKVLQQFYKTYYFTIFVLKRKANNFYKLEFIANRMFILLYYTASILFLISMTHQTQEQPTTSQEKASLNPIYIDSAYKQLLRQQLKANALKNRTKALNINQEHILKQVQNNQCILQKLNIIKSMHAQDAQMLSKDKQKKLQITQQQKQLNQIKRKSHQKQMSTIIQAQAQQRDKIRDQARKMRKQNQLLIDKNREQQQAKKKLVRNKIHDDIMQSRTTIKHFFTSKHDRIVSNTQQEIKKLNQKRIKQELFTLTHSGKIVTEMEQQMREMKNTLRDSRVGFDLKRQESRLKLNRKGEEGHPLVHKIEAVMNAYTKIL